MAATSHQSPTRRNQRLQMNLLLASLLLLMASFLSPCLSFRLQPPPSVAAKKAVTKTTTTGPILSATPSPLSYASSPLFRSRISNLVEQTKQQQQQQQSRRNTPPLFMTTDAEGDKKEVEEEEEVAEVAASEEISVKQEEEDSSSSSVASNSKKNDDNFEGGGVVRTILLAGPLFVKFAIVLVIKFATDLVVFPLLWLYRLARLTKRKCLRLIGRGSSNSSPNGKVNGSTTMTDKEWKDMKPNGQVIDAVII